MEIVLENENINNERDQGSIEKQTLFVIFKHKDDKIKKNTNESLVAKLKCNLVFVLTFSYLFKTINFYKEMKFYSTK